MARYPSWILLNTLGSDEILSNIDFAKNHKFQIYDEVQSKYFYIVFVTILVHITYRVIHDEERGTLGTHKESHFYICDGHKYNSLFI